MEAIILGSGSKGNSALIITNTKKVLIDVGFSFPKTKMILEKYNIKPKDIDFILLTHSHKDHIAGLSSFTKKEKKHVYIPKDMYKEVNKLVDADYIIPISNDEFIVDDLRIKFLYTSHDAISSVGFLLEDTNSLIYMTDTGYISKKNLKYMYDKNIYILESNHDPKMLMDGPYPRYLKERVISDKGHLSNNTTAKYLKKIISQNTKYVVLAHLSETNNCEELALKAIKDEEIDKDINILIAKQHEETIMIEV